MYRFPSSPRIPIKKSWRKLTPDSRRSCFLPGFSTLRLRTSISESTNSTAMITHVTTTLSAIGTPPNTGIVKAVLLSSSSASVADKFPVFLPPFLRPNQHIGHTGLSFDAFILRFVKKKSISILTVLYKKFFVFYTFCIIILNITSYYKWYFSIR